MLFLDIAPNQIFIKVFLYDDIDFPKLHQRGSGRKHSTGVGYKFDYSFQRHLKEKNEIKYLTDLKKIFNELKQKLDKRNTL